LTGILIAAGFFAFPPLYVLGLSRLMRLPAKGPWFFVSWACSGACGMAGELLARGSPAHAAALGASALLAMVLWWWSRRKRRKRSLRQLGEKMRAVFAAMARNMPRPGPVLRPAPQGARA
jgi:membrane associated rhomboid family serine protease